MSELTLETKSVAKSGRPRGSGKKLAVLRNWQPKEWTVEYEAITIGSCRGITNRELAKIFGKGEVQIGNILNCVRAVEFKETLRKNLPTKEVETTYRYVLEKATERLKNFIDNDTVFEKTPIAAVDRAMKSMEMIDARLRAREGSQTQNNTLVLATEANVARLLNAMTKSKLSDQINADRDSADLRKLTPIAVAG